MPPPSPPQTLRHRPPQPPPLSTSTQSPPSRSQTSPTQAPPPASPPLPQTLRSRALTSAVGLGLVTAAVGGTYLLSDNDNIFPFAVAACLATLSSLVVRFALTGIAPDHLPRHRVRARHFRMGAAAINGRYTGERAAYVRTSQRLAMMDRDFTDADYEMLLDLDNNSQRLRRFLEGASSETVDRLPTFVYGGDEKEDIGKREIGEKGSEIAGDTLGKCTICLEDFVEGMKIRILPCLHRFMADCIDPWLAQQARCPVCKYNIQEVMNSMPPGYAPS